jgi:hypothetical protein
MPPDPPTTLRIEVIVSKVTRKDIPRTMERVVIKALVKRLRMLSMQKRNASLMGKIISLFSVDDMGSHNKFTLRLLLILYCNPVVGTKIAAGREGDYSKFN